MMSSCNGEVDIFVPKARPAADLWICNFTTLANNGVADLIAVRRLTRKKTVTKVFSGPDGKPLPASLV
jgi:hypothetical protein